MNHQLEFSSERMLGEFSALDGTVEFYERINALLKPHFLIVDLGAGRGAWNGECSSAYGRSLRAMRGKVARVIGVDVDPAVLSNTSTDENLVADATCLPFANESVDVVIADFLLEHVADPAAVEREVYRIVRPGGVCARTPHALHYVSIGARLLHRGRAGKVLAAVQPARQPRDVFDTKYRCNTLRQLRRLWSANRWDDFSYLYTAEPSYCAGSRAIYHVLSVLHRVLLLPMVASIFVFQVKRGATCSSSASTPTTATPQPAC